MRIDHDLDGNVSREDTYLSEVKIRTGSLHHMCKTFPGLAPIYLSTFDSLPLVNFCPCTLNFCQVPDVSSL